MNAAMTKPNPITITSCANKTKWLELRERMLDHAGQTPLFRPKYLPRVKGGTWEIEIPANSLAQSSNITQDWDGEWYYHFRLIRYEEMEWVDLKPRAGGGAMGMTELSAICRDIGFDFEVHQDVVRIFGYRRGNQPD
jgi:hypothetical protein